MDRVLLLAFLSLLVVYLLGGLLVVLGVVVIAQCLNEMEDAEGLSEHEGRELVAAQTEDLEHLFQELNNKFVSRVDWGIGSQQQWLDHLVRQPAKFTSKT